MTAPSSDTFGDTPPADWSPCETGVLTGLGQRMRAEHTRQSRFRQAQRFTTAAAAALIVGAVVFAAGQGETVASISCQTCVQRFEAYHDHLAHGAPMDTIAAAETRKHLEECEYCRPKFEARYPGLLAATLAGVGAGVGTLLAMGGKLRLVGLA